MMKELAGQFVASLSPQVRFERALFVIGHMRCGSTAFSHILCSRPEVSGYGEAHIAYRDRSALGVLVLNQMRRGQWKSGAELLFDKILHQRYDAEAGPEFLNARTIFMAREPVATILSIRKLFSSIGSSEFADDAAAADYYDQRLSGMLSMWPRFPDDRRIGFSYNALLASPDQQLRRVSSLLGLTPPLTNRYVVKPEQMRAGAGDPLSSHKFDRIVPAEITSTVGAAHREISVSDLKMRHLLNLYAEAKWAFGEKEIV